MTKVINLHELLSERKEQEKKPIEFASYINRGSIDVNIAEPSAFENVMLISKSNLSIEYDVIAAWSNDERYDFGKSPAVFLGRWNDGIINTND